MSRKAKDGGGKKRKGKSGASSKGGSKGKGQKGPKPKPKQPSFRGTTEKARQRAAGLIPSPNFALIASDPLKAQVVAVAIQRPYAPSEFARDVGIGASSAAYVFKVLRDRNIIELVRTERINNSVLKHYYRANEAAFVGDADWGELSEALRPLFTGTILHDFSRRVTQAIETGHLYSRDDFCLYWIPRNLDEIAWEEHVSMIRWVIEESGRLEEDTVRRKAEGESDGGFHATFAIASFPSPTHSEIKTHERAQRKKKGGGKSGKGKSRAPKRKDKDKKGQKKGKGAET